MPSTTHRTHRRTAPRRVAALVTMLALLVAAQLPGRAHATTPSRVLPGTSTGSDVSLRPNVVRADEGRAELDVDLGAAAPGDVLVRLRLHLAESGPDGVVTAGGELGTGRVTGGGRVRPGERLRVTVVLPPDAPPALLVVTVTGAVDPAAERAADSDPGTGATELRALVLSGAAAPPRLVLSSQDGEVTGSVTAAAPTLVTVRLAGAEVVTLPDRLVLPGRALVVRAAAAAWPSPSVLRVTDETGRVTGADTGTGPIGAVAAVLLALTAAAVVGAAAHRRRSAST